MKYSFQWSSILKISVPMLAVGAVFFASGLVSNVPSVQGVGEASTRFHIYVPPNNISGRDTALIVTAVSDGTTANIVDDDGDGDSDDSVSNLSLKRGDSYIVYPRDGDVNDDARGKWDGDYFIITSDKPVLAQMSTNSDWQHDWAPSDNKTMKGNNFYIFSPPTSFSDRDVNVYAYEDDTQVAIYDITTDRITTTGKATVDIANGSKILQANLTEGEDLIVRNNLGVDLLDPGHSYYIQSTKPITVQYGALYDKTRNSARDGGGFVPANNGSSSGEKFYFFVPHNPGLKREIEIRIASFADENRVVLEGWNLENEEWDALEEWGLNRFDHADYVGGDYELFRATTTSGKKIAVFESNWLETGNSGTSDMASFLSAETGYGAGREFLAYMGPPGHQTNIEGQKGTYSHLFLFGHADGTSVTVTDADTGGEVFSQTYTMEADEYVDVKIDRAQYDALNSPSEGKRPYLRVSSNNLIAVLDTNWNDNWMTYATSVLLPTPKIDITANVHEAQIGANVDCTLTIENIGESATSANQVVVTLPTGLTYVSASGDLGSGSSESLENGETKITFTDYDGGVGANHTVNITATVNESYAAGGAVQNNDLFTITAVAEGTANGDLYVSNDSVVISAKDVRTTHIENIRALKNQRTVKVVWNTAHEHNNQGFRIFRSTKADGTYTEITSELVASKGNSENGFSYEYLDTVPDPNVSYFYKINPAPTGSESCLEEG